MSKSVKVNFFVFLTYLIIWYSVFRIAGTYTQGYNIYEDNQLITLTQKLDSNSIFKVGSDLIYENTFNRNRFTPVSEIHKLILVKLFRDNFTLYNIYLVILGIFTSFILYRFCINCGFGITLSFIFGISILAGPSALIWSQIYYAEHFSLFLFSVSLLYLSKSILSRSHSKNIYKYLFISFLALSFLCKESFILLAPAVTFIYLQLYSSFNKLSLKEAFYKNRLLVFIIFLLSLLVLCLIISLVGINNQGYAGLDLKKILSISFVTDYLKSIFTNLFFLTGLLIVLITYSVKKIFKKTSDNKNNVELNKDVLTGFVLLLLITLPQYLLFYKSGMDGRYFIPFILGISFFLIYTVKIIYLPGNVNRIFKIIVIIIIMIIITYEVNSKSVKLLSGFANVSKATMKVIDSIKENETGALLLVMDPAMNYHEVYSLQIYLDYLNSNKIYKYDFVKTDYLSKYFSDTVNYDLFADAARDKYRMSVIDSSKSNEDINTILVFVNLNKKFIKKNISWFKEDNFIKEDIGKYTLYRKK